ncbi:MAG: hypothetical protein MUC74_06070 [Ideonella sp.]|nr:hypothetical protein [Ideonella sp.]
MTKDRNRCEAVFHPAAVSWSRNRKACGRRGGVSDGASKAYLGDRVDALIAARKRSTDDH